MDFQYYLPTKIFCGEISNYVNEFDNYGKRALIVTGKSSAKNGSMSDVLSALDALSVEYFVFDKVEENPSLENVSDGAREGIRFGAEFIVAIGGGSPMDAAKAISVLIAYDTTDTALLFTNDAEQKKLPVLAVPTTAGTGSEVTPYSILTIHDKKTKSSVNRFVFCDKAFLNGRYMRGLPAGIIMSTAIDALTHLVEGYLSSRANFLTDKLAESGFLGFAEVLPSLMDGQFDDDFRERMLLVSSLAGIVITHTKTSLPHLMGYALTYNKNIPHGFACGILTYEYLAFHKDKAKIGRMLSLAGFMDMAALKSFFSNACPTVSCAKDELDAYAAAIYENKSRLLSHPYEVGLEDIFNIYNNSLL